MGDQDGGRQTKASAAVGLDAFDREVSAGGLNAGAGNGVDTRELKVGATALLPDVPFDEEELRVWDADLPNAQDADQRDRQTYAIIGAAMEVHRELGPGFLESVYGDALTLELQARSIPFAREVPCPIHYKRQRLNTRFTADFLCHGRIILELKATRGLGDADTAQALNYLKATGLRLALLLNFGGASLQHRRVVFTTPTPTSPPDFSA